MVGFPGSSGGAVGPSSFGRKLLRLAQASNNVPSTVKSRLDEPFAPNEDNDWTTPILQEASEWLVALGLCERINARTLYGWYLDAKKAGALSSANDTHSNSTSTA